MPETPAMNDQTRALLDRILKERQLLCQAGASADGLSIRLHPADYMTLGLERSDLVDVDEHGRPATVLAMPFVKDPDVPIGAPTVVRGKVFEDCTFYNNTAASKTPDFEKIAGYLVMTILDAATATIDDATRQQEVARVRDELRLLWIARGAADIAKLETVYAMGYTNAHPPMKTLDRALRTLDR